MSAEERIKCALSIVESFRGEYKITGHTYYPHERNVLVFLNNNQAYMFDSFSSLTCHDTETRTFEITEGSTDDAAWLEQVFKHMGFVITRQNNLFTVQYLKDLFV